METILSVEEISEGVKNAVLTNLSQVFREAYIAFGKELDFLVNQKAADYYGGYPELYFPDDGSVVGYGFNDMTAEDADDVEEAWKKEQYATLRREAEEAGLDMPDEVEFSQSQQDEYEETDIDLVYNLLSDVYSPLYIGNIEPHGNGVYFAVADGKEVRVELL